MRSEWSSQGESSFSDADSWAELMDEAEAERQLQAERAAQMWKENGKQLKENGMKENRRLVPDYPGAYIDFFRIRKHKAELLAMALAEKSDGEDSEGSRKPSRYLTPQNPLPMDLLHYPQALS